MAANAQLGLFEIEVEAEPEKPKPPATATFDAKQGAARKRRGMSAAASPRAELLAEVRAAMESLAMSRPDRDADADDAQRWLIAHGHASADLGNAAGSLFKRREWVPLGFAASERVSNNGRRIFRWRLK